MPRKTDSGSSVPVPSMPTEKRAYHEGERKVVAKEDAKPEAPTEEFFVVQADTPVPRGGAPFILRKGKRISSRGYDIPYLRKLGVPLQPAH